MAHRSNIFVDPDIPTASLRDELPLVRAALYDMWHKQWRRLLFGMLFGIVCSGLVYATYQPPVDFAGTAAAAEQSRRAFAESSLIWLTIVGYFIACTPWRQLARKVRPHQRPNM